MFDPLDRSFDLEREVRHQGGRTIPTPGDQHEVVGFSPMGGTTRTRFNSTYGETY
jgi:hypothetical protein